MASNNKGKNYVYSAYELKTGKELCIASADTQKELARQLGVTDGGLRRRMSRQKSGADCRDYYVMKVIFDDEDES